MTLGEQARWWGAGLILLCLLLWLLADALVPFILGMAIAYFADPLADRLERLGLRRLTAVAIITVASLGAVVLTVLLLLPSLVQQVQSAARNLPEYLEQARALADRWLPEIAGESAFVRPMLDTLRANAETWSVEVLQRLLSGGLALIDFLLILVVTPVVAFYMLWDWDRMIAKIDDWLPRAHRPVIHRLARDIDDVLAGFVRGQLTVCLILGTFYAIALTAVELRYGLLIGAFAGLISFIPFVGSIVGGVLSVGVGTVQFWGEPQWIVAVALIFAAGQAVEGNVLTPNMVGGHVKLHPVWLMFALAAFGTVFGFLGLLVAVPVAAVIGVLGRFLIERYKAGPLYRRPEVVHRHGRMAENRRRAAEAPVGDPADLDPGGSAERFGVPAELLREISDDDGASAAGAEGDAGPGAPKDTGDKPATAPRRRRKKDPRKTR